MKQPTVAVVAALLAWGVAMAQTGPPPAPPAAQFAPSPGGPPEAGSDIWSRMTPEQRRQLWQKLTPEEQSRIWQRLPPEQRKAIRDRLASQPRGPAPAGPPPRGPGPAVPAQPPVPAGAGPKLTPEERRQLRDEIKEEMHRQQMRPMRGRRSSRP